MKKLKNILESFSGAILIISSTSLLLALLCFKTNDIILIETGIAILYYTYYTYKVHKQSQILSASFRFIEPNLPNFVQPGDNHIYHVEIKNFTKFPIKVWCNIKPTILEKSVIIQNDFYGGTEFRTIQPLGIYQGWIDLNRFIKLAGTDYLELYDNRAKHDEDKIFTMDVEFKYSLLNDDLLTINPDLNYYYIFARRTLTLR